MVYALLALSVLFACCLWSPSRTQVIIWCRVLWVSRASAASALLGVLLFGIAPPARDLFAELAAGPLYWAVFFLLVLLWALIVHFAARRALEQEAWATRGAASPISESDRDALQRRYAAAGAWVPRVLGFLCFAAVALGIVGAKETSEHLGGRAAADAPGLNRLLIANGCVALAYLVFVVVRRLGTISLRSSLLGDPAAIIAEPTPFWFMRPDRLRARFVEQNLRHRRVGSRFGHVRFDVLALTLVGATLVCFLAAACFPVALSYFLPRAWFVPMMLGLPVFAVAFVTAISHYLRFPVVLLLVLILGWLATLAPEFHDTRASIRPDGAPERQIRLEDAFAQWKDLSCRNEPGPNCGRRPVILALAGGASRAAFFSATVIGDLVDITRSSGNELRDFSRQVFAISGVSGGSVGAAITRAAFEDAPRDGGPPCESADGLWFRSALSPGLNRFFGQTAKPETWKDCLQTLTAGDFLSPVILGLAFRDGFAGPIAFAKRRLPGFIEGDDRGALLELAFEGRYATVLAKPSSAWVRFRSLLARQALADRRALGRPFGRPVNDGRWNPLLLLNATSVDTGRRVIASELEPTHDKGVALFPEAYDTLAELRRTFRREGKHWVDGPLGESTDIPLSTAATLSARFPVVSPYGGLRHPSEPELADRVVDGGYFENDGVTTAYELARALAQFPDVQPVIVHITNDPVGRYDRRDGEGQEINLARPPDLPKARPSTFFESVLNPLTALFGTRGGHAAEAVRSVLLSNDRIYYVRFQVFDQGPMNSPERCDLRSGRRSLTDTRIDNVSMSWWLSGAVQEYLDRQLCQSDNANEYKRLEPLLAR